MGGEDFAFCGFEKQLKQKLFLTGFHGDKIWDLDTLPNTTISRGDISGSSLTEWRLRVGFIHLPVPFIGVTRHPDLHKISNSTDLKFFQINVKKYDRPIPRKIAEDMGVARAAFGQSKKAASNLFCHSLKAMSTESIEDLNSYWRQEFRGARLLHQKLRQHAFDTRLNGMRFVLRLIRRIFNTQLPVFWRMQSIWMTHGEKLNNLLTRMIVGAYRVFEHSSPLKSDLPFLWAVKKIRKRYRLIG